MDDNVIDTRVQDGENTAVKSAGQIFDKYLSTPLSDIPQLPESEAFHSSTSQLIVLGNGFDIQSGLKSRFRDFFNDRRKPLTRFLGAHPKFNSVEDISLLQTMQENDLNVWDIILYSISNTDWCDVESTIGEWVIKREEDSSDNSHFLRVLDMTKHFGADPKNNKRIIWKYKNWITEIYVACYLFQLNTNRKIKKEKLLYNFLLDELHRLENDFQNYLVKITDADKKYLDNAKTLLSTLLWDEITDYDEELDTSVLNFNYTDPLPASVIGDSFTSVNIHGDLDGKQIIFGIDGKDHMNDEDAVRFTKTYRLLELDNPDRAKLIQTKTQGGFDDSTNIIKFYGHSLNEADYSYFQAIFDGVDLYESHTRLIFYYRPRKRRNSRISQFDIEVQQDMFHKVTKLLNTYGDTMHENPDHGKNLMHKLLLEGRLSVKRFEYR